MERVRSTCLCEEREVRDKGLCEHEGGQEREVRDKDRLKMRDECLCEGGQCLEERDKVLLEGRVLVKVLCEGGWCLVEYLNLEVSCLQYQCKGVELHCM